MDTFKVVRKGSHPMETVTAEYISFERTHVVFVDDEKKLVSAFRAEDVIEVYR